MSFLGVICIYKSYLVMSFVYLFYGTECVMQRAPCSMFCMELSMMVMCLPFAQMFKLSGVMCSIKVFMLNYLSPCNTSMLKPFSLYMLLTVFNSLMIFSALFEIKFSDAREVILHKFV